MAEPIDERAASSSTSAFHSMEVDESVDNAHSLPRADGGKDAWLALAACFTLEALVWGVRRQHCQTVTLADTRTDQ